LTRDRFTADPPPTEQVRALRREVRAAIAEVAGRVLRAGQPSQYVATSKTFRQLARIAGAAPSSEGPYVQRSLSLAELRSWTPKLASLKASERTDLPGVSQGRAAQLVAGAVVAEAAMDLFHAGTVDICPWALREGVILCFIGPPGVGKTSLGRSIAHAMGRKFIRISLGGMRDEAEIRGHRRTYIGAMPGRILQAIRRIETRNPVFMLDEIDKLGMDFHGDPASALLEVLDPEQNSEFRDHYLEVAYDLSQVMFITTGNLLEPIPDPLRDRMEIINLSGYTENEKCAIAKQYLIPRQIKENGLRPEEIQFTDEAMLTVIRSYTREAGVRNLEREIGSVCRKVVTIIAENKTKSVTITPEKVEEFLGRPHYFGNEEIAIRTSIPGVATGLAYTPVGGDVLFIEATRMPGSKGFQITGSLGNVMQESAHAALSFVRSRAEPLKLDQGFFEKSDIHLHIPAGAQPKDGPSAGVNLPQPLLLYCLKGFPEPPSAL